MGVVVKYSKGKYERKGTVHFVYGLHRFPYSLKAVFKKYRRRFGIESSHRKMGGRVRTTSQSVVVRLLLVGVAFFLYNLWVWLKWEFVSLRRRGRRRVWHRWFTFRRMLLFLRRALEAEYQVVEMLGIAVAEPG